MCFSSQIEAAYQRYLREGMDKEYLKIIEREQGKRGGGESYMDP